MQRFMLKSQIHHIRVTEANLHYEGSITLDEDLMDAADIQEDELAHVLDLGNGARLETYAIAGPRGSGVCCINGAAARLVGKGDIITVVTYANLGNEVSGFVPRMVYVNERNEIVKQPSGAPPIAAHR